jgi:hypothetical protein
LPNSGAGSLLSSPGFGTVTGGRVLNTGPLTGTAITSLIRPINTGQFQNQTLTGLGFSPILTSGFGVSSGLTFNNGLGGTPFGLGSTGGFSLLISNGSVFSVSTSMGIGTI